MPALRKPGLIEAFYGRMWTGAERLAVLGQLAQIGFDHYIYAPKGDPSLRKGWREPFAESALQDLAALLACGRRNGMAVGIGLTPHGLQSLSARGEREALRHKAGEIAALKIDQLYILFDDLPASGRDMAREQLRVVDLLLEHSGVDSAVVCPSFYSSDPVLEKVFGPRPRDYWQQLGQGLDQGVGLCWTGEQVCSEHYSRDNLSFIAEAYRRRPVLWDNYPVNDGEKLCKRLRLNPFSERQLWLADYTAAHLANPMNQPMLSLLPLASLPAVYAGGAAATENLPEAWATGREGVCGELLACLAEDADAFQHRGLDGFSADERRQFIARYQAFSEPHAREVVDWLEGAYAFDPACLTD